MQFDIALLSAHGTARGHYLVGICRNFDCNFTFAGVDNDSSLDYNFLFRDKLKNYSEFRGNLINIDNSLGSRSAPVNFYKRMLKENALVINLVRDPLKKFCTVYNFFGYNNIVNQKYALLDGDLRRNVEYMFCKRYWDNVMARSFIRFSDIYKNFIFLDSEDLRENKVRSTFELIQRCSGLNMDVPQNISLHSISSYEDKFLEAYEFYVVYDAIKYTFKLTTRIPDEKLFYIEVENVEIVNLFSAEFMYVYTDALMCRGINADEFTVYIKEKLSNEVSVIGNVYKKYLKYRITVESFCEVIYSNSKFYDSFKYSVCDDAEYIIKKYPRCESYWDAFGKIEMQYPSKVSKVPLEYTYNMQNDFGTALLRNGWGSIHSAGVDAICKNMKVCMPVRSDRLSLVTINYHSSHTGKIKICANGYEVASGNLKVGCLCFPLPKVLVVNKKMIEFDVAIEQNCEEGSFTLYSIINSLH